MNHNQLIKGTGLIAGLTSISRLLGFIRDMAVAAVFGAGLLTDAFFVALKIPNLLRSMVAEGALTSAFVPIYTQNLKHTPNSAAILFRNMTGVLLTITTALALIGIIFSPQIVMVFAPGFDVTSEIFDLSVNLTRIMFPFIITISLVAMINGALNCHAIFGAAPIAQIVMNLCLVLGTLIAIFLPKEMGIYMLAWSVLFSGLAQIAVQIPLLQKAHLTLIPLRPFFQKQTYQVLMLMLPSILGATVYQLSIFINTILASTLVTGSISWLFYADRLSQLPIGIIVVSLGSVLLPTLSSNWAESNKERFQKDLLNSIRFTGLLIIPVATAVVILAQPICVLLFERGQFSAVDSWQTARALQASGIGLWGVSVSYLIMRGFMATKDTVTPSIIGVLTLLLTLIISLALMGKLDQNSNNWIVIALLSFQQLIFVADFGHAALAASAGLSATLLLPISIYLLERRTGVKLALFDFIKSTTILLFASGLNYLTITWLASLVTAHWLHMFWQGLIIIIIYYLVARLAGLSELQQAQDLIKARLTKRV